jgi:hypothetical protein
MTQPEPTNLKCLRKVNLLAVAVKPVVSSLQENVRMPVELSGTTTATAQAPNINQSAAAGYSGSYGWRW